MILARALPADDPAHAVDVAGHKMTAHLARGPQRPLQVHGPAHGGRLQIRAVPRFHEQIELEQLAGAFGRFARLDHGQTAAVDGHAGADPRLLSADFSPHGQLNRLGRRVDPLHHACFFHNACEHAPPRCRTPAPPASGKLTARQISLITQAAAEFLGVSRPFVVGLMESEAIPHHKDGAHRRVYLKDVLEYQTRRDRRRRATLDGLSAQVDAARLYE